MKPRSKSVWMTPAAAGPSSLADRPGAGFLLAGGEVGAEAEEVVDGADEVGDADCFDAHAVRNSAPSSGRGR